MVRPGWFVGKEKSSHKNKPEASGLFLWELYGLLGIRRQGAFVAFVFLLVMISFIGAQIDKRTVFAPYQASN
jgi:hypothetical protein